MAGLKALLEHNVVLNLVADHNPDAHKGVPVNLLTSEPVDPGA